MKREATTILATVALLGVPGAAQEIAPMHALEPHETCTILMPASDDPYVVQTWTGGVVPYTFHANVSTTNQNRAMDAMNEISSVSNVEFVPRTTESNYIRFTDSSGNSAAVGMQGGLQSVNVVSWTSRFIIVHEIMHALGTWHEQQRTDRDLYVQINWENLQPGTSGNFTTRTGTFTGSYDFDSVMHYGPCGFSTCCSLSCQAITVLPPNEAWQWEIGQRERLSEGDIHGLLAIYGLPCTMDVDRNGEVGFGDILTVLANWGPCPGCLEDVSGNGVIDFGDILLIISEWGPCE